jgi:hypothetical protein
MVTVLGDSTNAVSGSLPGATGVDASRIDSTIA